MYNIIYKLNISKRYFHAHIFHGTLTHTHTFIYSKSSVIREAKQIMYNAVEHAMDEISPYTYKCLQCEKDTNNLLI